MHARRKLFSTRVTERVALALATILAATALTRDAHAQCGGTPQCPVAPLPFGLPPSSTEINPPAFSLGTGQAGEQCYYTQGNILAASISEALTSEIGTQELVLFTDLPAIEVVIDEQVNTHAFQQAGDPVYAAGTFCAAIPDTVVGSAFAVTERCIGVLAGTEFIEHPLPEGVGPVTAAGIGACDANGNTVFSLCVQLSNDSIECISGGVTSVFEIPNPIVAVPESFSSGPASGFVVFDATNAYVVTGGNMLVVQLGGTYVSHVASLQFSPGLSVTIELPDGQLTTTFVGLGNCQQIIPFASCSTPLQPCPPASAPRIAMNLGPCAHISAGAAAWPPAGTSCALGECCHFGGVCERTAEYLCRRDGGAYSGDATECTPTGACCLQDYTSVETSETCCEFSSGTYLGDGVAAGPPGACCRDSNGDSIIESCAETSQACCDSVAGQFHLGQDCGTVGYRLLRPDALAAPPFTISPPPRHWDLREFTNCRIPYTINDVGHGDAGTFNEGERLAIDAAFASWKSVQPAIIDAYRQPTTTSLHDVVETDGHNVFFWANGAQAGVLFGPAPSGVIAYASLYNASGPDNSVIVQADVVFNDRDYQWTDGSQDLISVETGFQEPYPVWPGQQLHVRVDGGSVQTVTFVSGAVPGAMTAEEVALDLSTALTGARVVLVDWNLAGGPEKVRLESLTTDGTGTIEIVGGSANHGLNFPCQERKTRVVDVETIAVHEIGHFFGVGHSNTLAGPPPTPAEEPLPVMLNWARPDGLRRALQPQDRQALNFLYTPDLGDAPDPWFGFNAYQSNVHSDNPANNTPAISRVLNGVDLYEPALGPYHLFGHPGSGPCSYDEYEWLGAGMDGSAFECESRQVDADQFDDGVVLPDPLIRGQVNVVTVTISHSAQIGRYFLVDPRKTLYFNGYFDFNNNGIFDAPDWELHWSGVPDVPASPSGIIPMVQCNTAFQFGLLPGGLQCDDNTITLQFGVFVPLTAPPLFGCRFRLDYGEDEGNASNWSGDLGRAVGAAQFGEVEDYMCRTAAPLAVCGNGIPEEGEDCDDGNTESGDGCDENCQIEPCFAGSGDCCDPAGNGTPGCDNPECCALVCAIDDFCCTDVWDDTCAAAALYTCDGAGQVCGPACSACPTDVNDDGQTGSADLAVLLGSWGPCDGGDCVCLDSNSDGMIGSLDLATLLGAWGPCVAVCGDESCDANENCQSCSEDCGPCGGDCCTGNDVPGCGDADCEACVCSLDAYCCDVSWDSICAGEACSPCSALCSCCQVAAECGNGVQESSEQCDGADDAACPGECNPDCTCPVTGPCSPGAGDCFVGNGTPGCDDIACCQTICAFEPFCCEVSWDGICADEALDLCGAIPECTAEADCGPDESCVDGACVPLATGRCCHCQVADPVCELLTGSECQALTGQFGGDGSDCSGEPEMFVVDSAPNLTIPDCSSEGVSDMIVVSPSFDIVDLSVGLTIDHSWIGDLCVTLSKDGGAAVTLIERMGFAGGCDNSACCGCSADSLDIVLADEGAGPIDEQCQTPLTGTWIPDEPLGAVFAGLDGAGEWVLTVTDNACGDLGSLLNWSLQFAQGGAGGNACEGLECGP